MMLVRMNGGIPNGNAYPDSTFYYETLPANQLELGLFLEADRMRSLSVDQASLDNERKVVLEERRLRIDNQAYGQTEIAIPDTAYESFAYKHPVIGTVEDLNAARLEDVVEFFKAYYSPSNAVVTVVGDLKTEETLDKIKKYFEDIPSRSIPPQPDTAETEQKGERRKTIEDPFAQTPRLDIVYKVPPENARDGYWMNLMASLLTLGPSSRLYQKLVKEKEVAASISKRYESRRGPSLAGFSIWVRPGKDLAEVEKLVYEEIDRLKVEPVADWEFEKGRLQVRHERWQQFQSTLIRAIMLGQYSALFSDPGVMNAMDAHISQLTREEVLRLARTYFRDTNRTVVTTLPRAMPAAPVLTAPATQTPRASRPLISQEPETIPVAQVARKNRAPVSNEILRFKMPKVTEAQLRNGATVLVMEHHRVPLVWVQLTINGSGSLYDQASQTGVASMTARMLSEGTKTRTSQQIAEAIDKTGARILASSVPGSTTTVISAVGLKENFDEWFSLLTDILLNAVFPADELNSLKQRLKVQLRQQRSTPAFLANERFSSAVFGDHPAAVVSPSFGSIDSITPESLAAWHRGRYAPQNAILGIAGAVRAAEVIPKIEKWLAGWQKTDVREVLPPNPAPASARKIYLVDRPDSVQSTLLLGSIAIDRRDPDYIPMTVMNGVLGSGPGSRFWMKLREEKGYVYNVGSLFTALKYPGAWRASADMRTEATEGALGEFLSEIRRICEEKVSQSELEDARRTSAASFALSLEQMAQMLSYAIARKSYGFSADYWDSYPAKVMAVSGEEVQRVASRYISPDLIQVVVVGDARKIREVLEKFGPVEVYDAEGNNLSATRTSQSAAVSKTPTRPKSSVP